MKEKRACSLPFLCDGIIQSTSEIICDCSCHRLLAKLTTVNVQANLEPFPQLHLSAPKVHAMRSLYGACITNKTREKSQWFYLRKSLISCWPENLSKDPFFFFFFPHSSGNFTASREGKKENLEYQDTVSKFFCYAKIARTQKNFSPSPVSQQKVLAFISAHFFEEKGNHSCSGQPLSPRCATPREGEQRPGVAGAASPPGPFSVQCSYTGVNKWRELARKKMRFVMKLSKSLFWRLSTGSKLTRSPTNYCSPWAGRGARGSWGLCAPRSPLPAPLPHGRQPHISK